MFIVLKQAGYFARQHARPLLFIALVLSVPGWILDYTLTPAVATPEADSSAQNLGVSLLLTLLAVVQFAAAMIYIHQQVTDRPVSAIQAIAMSASRLGPLLVINALMAVAIGGGLLLLVAPGLYMAYKLMFAEFYLLFHGQRPLQALRSSYRDNTDLSAKLLPPLLFWGGLIATTAIGQQLLLQQGQDPLVINLLCEATVIALTLWGWALMYRLYQLHIEPGVPDTRKDTALSESDQNAKKEPDQ
ncbi:MAG: hypothetical protein ACJAWL_001850 [Motiliproteus sp.]|jgi:hypothetical protein